MRARRLLARVFRKRPDGAPVTLHDPHVGGDYLFRLSAHETFRASEHNLIVLSSLRQWATASGANLQTLVDAIVRHHKPAILHMVIRRTCTDLPAQVAVPSGWVVVDRSKTAHAYRIPPDRLTELGAFVDRFAVRSRSFFSFLPSSAAGDGVGGTRADLDMDFLVGPDRDGRIVLIYDTDDDFAVAVFPNNAATQDVVARLVENGLVHRAENADKQNTQHVVQGSVR